MSDIDELTREARRGLAPAQTLLGICYLEGTGVARDYAAALKWLSAAAKKGAPRAMFHLARMHELASPSLLTPRWP
jgi:TPR repeat protein